MLYHNDGDSVKPAYGTDMMWIWYGADASPTWQVMNCEDETPLVWMGSGQATNDVQLIR